MKDKLVGSNEGLHGFEEKMEDLEGREKFKDEGKRGREGKVRGKLREKVIKFRHKLGKN